MLLKNLFRSAYCIDDNATDRFIAERYLKNLLVNPEVTLFENGKDAIDQLISLRNSNSDKTPDYILLDLNMPFTSGWDFLDEIYRLKIDLWCPSIVYILSSSVRSKDVEKSKLYPIVGGFITKPLDQDKFKASLLGSYQSY